MKFMRTLYLRNRAAFLTYMRVSPPYCLGMPRNCSFGKKKNAYTTRNSDRFFFQIGRIHAGASLGSTVFFPNSRKTFAVAVR